jgi:hypothetical protein
VVIHSYPCTLGLSTTIAVSDTGSESGDPRKPFVKEQKSAIPFQVRRMRKGLPKQQQMVLREN